MGRKGRCRQMSLACVGSTRGFPAALGLPLLRAGVCAFLVLGSRLLSREQALCCVHFPGLSRSVQVVPYSTKAPTQLGLCLCLPRPSSSGSQELDERTLLGCDGPSPLHGPSLSFRVHLSGVLCASSGELASSHDPPSRCQPSRISGTLWLETGSLFAVW